MHNESVEDLRCTRAASGTVAANERGARFVVGLTAAMMLVELVTGYATGSMALTADGWHMATHAGALGLSALAYWYARTRADDATFSFGTGKVHALAGYTSAVALLLVALSMLVESIGRLGSPVEIHFAEALPVAVIGLLVNLASVFLLGGGHHHDHADHGDHDHHAHGHDHHEAHGHEHGPHDHHGHDHNHRAAFFHVLADAFTSVLAIGALLCGKYLGWTWMDPAMGIVGGLVIAKWGVGLCRAAGKQLLDASAPAQLVERIRSALEAIDDVRVADLHVWEMGPGQYNCIVSLVASAPRDVANYRTQLLAAVPLAHLSLEVHRCATGHEVAA